MSHVLSKGALKIAIMVAISIFITSCFCISHFGFPFTPAHAQTTASGFRSLQHPFEETSYHELSRMFPPNMAPIIASNNTSQTTLFAIGLNNIRCALLLSNETWLGTDFGMKRLNTTRRTVQHYTTLDGLPYDSVGSVTGAGDQIFCTVLKSPFSSNSASMFHAPNQPPQSGNVALCHFERPVGNLNNNSIGKWKSVVEETLSAPYAATAIGNRNYVALVSGAGVPGRTLVILVRLRDGSVERVPLPADRRVFFDIHGTQMDDRFLWVGTPDGLLRYDLSSRSSETLSAGNAFYGMTLATDGSLWALAKTTGSLHASEHGAVRDANWFAMHLAQGRSVRIYPLLTLPEHDYNENNIVLENPKVIRGRLWWAQRQHIMAGHGQFPYLPEIDSLDLETGRVGVAAKAAPTRPSNYQDIPIELLASIHAGWGDLVPHIFPELFPGWFCTESYRKIDTLTSSKLDVKVESTSRAQFMPEWYARNTGKTGEWHITLEHRKQMPSSIPGSPSRDEAERFTPSPVTMAMQEHACFPVPVGDHIYFLSGMNDVSLRVWDRKTGKLDTVSPVTTALKRYRPLWEGGYRMFPGKGCIWIGNGQSVLRYDLKSGHVDIATGDMQKAQSYVPAYSMLSVEGDIAWVKSGPDLLYKADPLHAATLIPVTLPTIPGDFARNAGQSQPKNALCAVADGIAWFTETTLVTPRQRKVIGYDLAKHRWTRPHELSLAYMTPGDCLTTVASVEPSLQGANVRWFPSMAREASAYGYVASKDDWILLPPVDARIISFEHQLIAVDGDNAWLQDDLQILHLNRRTSRWNSVPLRSTMFFRNKPGSIRAGNELLLGTESGLWRYDLQLHPLTKSPDMAMMPKDIYFHVIAWDDSAVWLSLRRAQSMGLARFDRRTHAWRYWAPSEWPPQVDGELTPNGQTCWIRVNDTLYHLNLKSNKWENFSIRLAKGAGVAPVRQVLVVGDETWLVAGKSDRPYYTSNSIPTANGTPISPLFRVRADGTVVPIEPTPGKPLVPRSISIAASSTKGEGKSLVLASDQGLYRLDLQRGSWSPVELPVLPPGIKITPVATRSSDGYLWVFGDTLAVRYRNK